MLVGASGLSYEEAANICHCAVGTIKSRVSRARDELKKTLTEDALAISHSEADQDALEPDELLKLRPRREASKGVRK
jgi:RNA polymerase sigma-70 factor (ECF subfamily)